MLTNVLFFGTNVLGSKLRRCDSFDIFKLSIKIGYIFKTGVVCNFGNIQWKGLVKIFVGGSLPTQRSIDLGMSAVQTKEVKIVN